MSSFRVSVQISIVLTLALSILLAISFTQSINFIYKVNPKLIDNSYEHLINKVSKKIFTNIIIEKDEYRYYMNPNDFIKCSDEELIGVFQLAASDFLVRTNDKNKSKITLDVLSKISLYSSLNGEFLADCQIPEHETKAFKGENKKKIIEHYIRKNWKPELKI